MVFPFVEKSLAVLKVVEKDFLSVVRGILNKFLD